MPIPIDLKFVPWPLPRNNEGVIRSPYDPSTWGSECARGFVRDERFATGSERVIKGTNRNVSRKWRALDGKEHTA